MILDLLVIGGGPAGLSAALVAAGNELRVCVLEASGALGGQVRLADHAIGEVLGLPVPSGVELAAAYEAHAIRAGLDVVRGARASRVRVGEESVEVEAGSEVFRARRLLLATGLRPRTLGAPGEHLLDPGSARLAAPSLAGATVAVIGGGDEASDTARVLGRAGAKVYLVARSGLRARPNFAKAVGAEPNVEQVLRDPVARLEGEGRVARVVLSSGRVLAVDRAWARIGSEAAVPPMTPTVRTTPDGRVLVDAQLRTSLPAVYAAGDLVRPPSERYIAAACADGTLAARAIESDLRGA